MRIHLISVIKDEADIVGQTLDLAAEWADHIYVRDIGSTDGTLDILHDAARKSPHIQVYSEPAPVYTDSLRRDVYFKFRGNSKPGDFWGRFDSDEIALEDPRLTFQSAKPWDDMFWGSFFNFYMTEVDVERFDMDPSLYDDDTPIQERMLYYLNNWSEPRFFREHRGVVWREGRDWPSLVNHCVNGRVPFAHYSYRSPKQIDDRLASRWKISATGDTVYSHDILPDFEGRMLFPTQILDDPLEKIAWAKQKAVERNGVPDVTWRDRIISSDKLVRRVPGEALAARPDLLPEVFPQSGVFGRLARRLVRSVLSTLSRQP